jgi:hypothetical protein
MIDEVWITRRHNSIDFGLRRSAKARAARKQKRQHLEPRRL